jgi:hypothetical protein
VVLGVHRGNLWRMLKFFEQKMNVFGFVFE